MASDDEKRVKAKKEKKEKRRSETDGVHKSKKDKKEKKAKDDKLKKKIATALEEQLEADAASASAIVKKSKKAAADIESEDDHPGSDFEEIKNAAIETALVYFALPIADAKGHKKIYKTIKKARKAGALQRGVKEVNKALRKTPLKTPSSASSVPGIAIIAGDISPDEVIMHLPLYCEEHNVPYLFVTSRLELGTAAKTKRPTSVVFLTEKGRERKPKAGEDSKMKEDDDEEDAGDYAEAYKELLKLAQKEYTKQMKDVLRN
ncbi:putative h aca ribonucleoprotein complex subunit 2 protein [Phaeoacremonium minimum UCRPA7]|uniref:Putative h aca ribonucleoprotein complex subunit 2 protein n=1 Tax=Phaeoacremonium minimum (strain UCR-PA7) TaxID=1286976 RepID=R8BU74_PHAM7|nr:putative h aca ribonucleoprotein complex subunit 2 protein [Phaeoacremonium minimum UCRPA7]EOO02911.1 putative h aca ribonucleoprotein complex subunit 2 protein [Phaeoacremonium minimum UCRPA7]